MAARRVAHHNARLTRGMAASGYNRDGGMPDVIRIRT
jgi:hypothetical protein